MPTNLTQISQGDIGATIRVRSVNDDGTPQDISAATGLALELKKPDVLETVVTVSAVFTTDGTDGYFQWTSTVVGDFDVCGRWEVRGYFTLGAWTGHLLPGYFIVAEVPT